MRVEEIPVLRFPALRPDPNHPGADLYHCINLDRPYDLYLKMVEVHQRGARFIISSIHRPNAWLEKFRRFDPPNGWAGRLFYRSPLGNKVGRSESVKDALRLVKQGGFPRWNKVFPGWTKRARWLIMHAKNVLLLARKEADAFAEDFGVSLTSDKMRLLPNWVSPFGDPSPAQPSEFKSFSERPIIVVGRIEAAKNSVRICRLASQVGRPLAFVGKANPYEKRYLRQFQDLLEQSPSVRWIPGVARSELPAYYCHAAFLLNCSYFEGCPWVDMEALLFGCPLLTTCYALHHEFLPADVRKCDPYDDQDLLRGLQWHPEPRPPVQPIDPGECKAELIKIYEQVLN